MRWTARHREHRQLASGRISRLMASGGQGGVEPGSAPACPGRHGRLAAAARAWAIPCAVPLRRARAACRRAARPPGPAAPPDADGRNHAREVLHGNDRGLGGRKTTPPPPAGYRCLRGEVEPSRHTACSRPADPAQPRVQACCSWATLGRPPARSNPSTWPRHDAPSKPQPSVAELAYGERICRRPCPFRMVNQAARATPATSRQV
jgi:hypothetical protein